MNLFELTHEAKTILAMEDMDEQTVKDTLEGLGLEDKFVSYSVVIKTLGAEEEALKTAIKSLGDKKQVVVNKVSRLKESCLQAMLELDMTKAGNAIHSITIRKGSNLSKLVIDDDAHFPDLYVDMIEKRDNAGLKKAIKDGDTFEGFHLEDGEPSVLIK